MFTTKVYDEHGKLIETRKFRTFDKMTDYNAAIVGCMLDAATIQVDNGSEVSTVDCWQLRDKAVVDGYELPVHRQMLARDGR